VELCCELQATPLSPALGRALFAPGRNRKPCQNKEGWDASPTDHPPPPQQAGTSAGKLGDTWDPPHEQAWER